LDWQAEGEVADMEECTLTRRALSIKAAEDMPGEFMKGRVVRIKGP